MHKCLFTLTALGSEGGCETPRKSMAARDKPGGIEPAIGLAVIRQPVDVPMADEGRIGGIDRRPRRR
jgi:hypothetical protein